jgi:putative two-component system response regulator
LKLPLDEAIVKQGQIVVIDDEPSNLALLERILHGGGFRNVTAFSDPIEALRACSVREPDLVILDLNISNTDGLRVLAGLREAQHAEYLPIVIYTADVNMETRTKALSLGASDFLTKPGEATEITLRVRNLLQTKVLHRQLKLQNKQLDEQVRSRTFELEAARLEALERLARAAEFRDDDTGMHAQRVGAISSRVAARLELPDADPELIELAAPLHDIGKIGIPDHILLKAGKLTTEEFEIMKKHSTIGAKILGGSNSPVLKLAAAIALTHHEKWNGTGYPLGLTGEQIPLAGRIVAVADVFDALTHERPYKRAWTQPAAVDYIKGLAGTDFDPLIVAAFCRIGRTSLLFAA